MNWIISIISFLVGSGKNLFKAPGLAFTQQVVLHVRALTIVIITCIGSLALFCVGISLFISSIAQILDKNEAFAVTAGMGVYLALVIVSLVGLVYGLRRQTWLNAMGFKEAREETPQASAIEGAIAMLLMDFVEERKNRRAHNEPASGPASSAP